MSPPVLGGDLCDSPNYLLLVENSGGRFEYRHGALFSSTDPEAMGRALALALSRSSYGDAVSVLLGAGWSLHVPAFSGAKAVSLIAVVKDTDAWVCVGYPLHWRQLVQRKPFKNPVIRPLFSRPPPNSETLIVSGTGPFNPKISTKPVPATEIVNTAESYYLNLRLLKLI